jgi:hypothetical protein
MNLDLDNILGDWPHEPGQIKVRRIVGNDGREKIQLRLDLGVIQMNVAGRPDGQHPHGCESLLEWHKERAEEAAAAGEKYQLNAEECGELQQEGIQYYHRYISLFQLEDFHSVVRDTQRNLELFNFVAKHAERAEFIQGMEQFRPYVTMMNTRARASIELDRGDFGAAERQIERGKERILEAYKNQGSPEAGPTSPEIVFLDEWLNEVRSKRPLSRLERLHKEMDEAIAHEAYERAAELRDQIRAQEQEQNH